MNKQERELLLFKFDEETRRRQFDRYDTWGRFWIELANTSLSDISKHLITAATILLPISASVLAIPIQIDLGMRHALFAIWFSLMVSICAGIFQSFEDGRYFRQVSVNNITRAEIYANGNLKLDEMRAMDGRIPPINPIGPSTAAYVQVSTFILATLLLLVLGYKILFSCYL